MDVNDIIFNILNILHNQKCSEDLFNCRLINKQWYNLIKQNKAKYFKNINMFLYLLQNHKLYYLDFTFDLYKLIKNFNFHKKFTLKKNTDKIKIASELINIFKYLPNVNGGIYIIQYDLVYKKMLSFIKKYIVINCNEMLVTKNIGFDAVMENNKINKNIIINFINFIDNIVSNLYFNIFGNNEPDEKSLKMLQFINNYKLNKNTMNLQELVTYLLNQITTIHTVIFENVWKL